MNVDIKMLNTETKETNYSHAEDLVEHIVHFFHKDAYSIYDAPSFKLYIECAINYPNLTQPKVPNQT